MVFYHFDSEKNTTEPQILRLLEYATDRLNNKHTTGIVFVDVAKAFDWVWHERLTYKMHQMRLPKNIVPLIAS